MGQIFAQGMPSRNPVILRGGAVDILRKSWEKSDVFYTSLPAIRLSNPHNIGVSKVKKIRRAFASWVPLVNAVNDLIVGRISNLGPRHEYLIVRGHTERLDPLTGISSHGIWEPPDGWEDLVLVGSERITAWCSTHNRELAVCGEFADGAGDVVSSKEQLRVVVDGESIGCSGTMLNLDT